MIWLLVFVVLVLIFQVAIFFVIRAKRRKDKQDNMMEKYNIRSAADMFRLLQDHELPERDREKIEELYKETHS